MCLIVAKSRGVALPLEEHLREGCSSNKDGTGVCYWKEGDKKVHIKKDFLSFTHFYFWLQNNITEKDSLIIHFRKATSGLVDEGNRHPFPVTSDPELIREVNLTTKLAVAHNGVFFKFSSNGEFNRDKKHSDTQNFIMEILSDKVIHKNLDNLVIVKLLDEFIGSNKLAFMDKEGCIALFGSYENEEAEGGKIFFSNSGYKTLIYHGCVTHRYGRGYSSYEEELDIYNNWYNGRGKGKIKENKFLSFEEVQKLAYNKKNSETKKIKEEAPIEYHSRNGKRLTGTCEGGCGHVGNVLPMEGEGRNYKDIYYLCKKCRKKVRKRKLILEESKCENCEQPKFISELKNKFNKFPLCRNCIGEYSDV